MSTATQENGAWTPDWATHPGEHLAEYLDVRGLKQAEFARLADVTPKLVSEIINGKNPVSPDTAIKFERVLGLKAHIWTGLQSDWDLHEAKKRKQAQAVAPEVKSWLARFPLRELKTIKGFPQTHNDGELLEALLGFFGIGELNAYDARLRSCAVHHRQSKAHQSLPDHIFTWLMLGEHAARNMNLPVFDEKKFLASVTEIRGLTTMRPDEFSPKMMKLCRGAGVALVFVPPIRQTRLFGSARWIDGGQRAIIQMSLRMKTNDHFWWTFFHECGHIILHRGKNFADDQRAQGDGHETEADRWAEAIIYGHNRLPVIRANPPATDGAIRRLASDLNLHPGIIVGMLQHYRHLHFGRCNHLKAKFALAD